MRLTRDDMLRELELLPVWQLRPEAALTKRTDLPATETTKAHPSPASPAPVMEQVSEPVLADLAASTVLSAESAVAHVSQAGLSETSAPIAPKIAVAWWLCCPQADADEACQTLLNNIIHAMQLRPNEYVVVQHAQDLTRYQAQKILLFGLAAFNALAVTPASDLEALRGVPQPLSGHTVWVTYHPAQMLADPTLKRGAWQDICAALAHP